MAAFIGALAVAGCVRVPETPWVDVACEPPRPQVCTREYRPVCALYATGQEATAASACMACADAAVVGYREEACAR